MLREHQTANPLSRWTRTMVVALVVLGGVASAAHGDEGSLEQRRSRLQVPTAPHGGVQAPNPGPRGGDIMPLPTPPPGPPTPRIPPAWVPPSGDSAGVTGSDLGALWFRLLGLIRGQSM